MEKENKLEPILEKENSHPDGRFGFLLQLPMDYYFHKEIYNKLPAAEFILYYEGPKHSAVASDVSHFLNSRKVHWRFFDETSKRPYYREQFFERYQGIIAHRNFKILWSPILSKKAKIRILYGPGKDLWDFHPWNRVFNLILTYGRYSDNYLKLWAETKIIGNPKFDPWFLKKIPENDINQIKNVLNSEKQTILYLPTYGELSSIEMILVSLKSLASKYNIIVKVHDITKYYEVERFASLISFDGFQIYDGCQDILPLLESGDVVISDNSGAIFDAILADKPLLTINNLTDEYFESLMEKTPQRLDGKRGRSTSKQSIEQQIKNKNWGPGPVVDESENLGKAIVESLKNDRYGAKREYWREKIFSFNDGRCAERAANEIKKIINLRQLPPKTLMAEIIDVYENEFKELVLANFKNSSLLYQISQKIAEEPSYFKKTFWLAKLLTKL